MNKAECKDFLHILSFISSFRLFNLVLLQLSYWHSRFYRKVRMWGLPWAVSLETNNTCNLSCPECPTGNGNSLRPKGAVDIDDFLRITQNLPSQVFYINLFLLGEPLLHPSIIDFIKILKKRNVYVSVSTNGQLLNEYLAKELVCSGLDRLIVSVDGYDQASYEKYRINGDFQLTLEGIKQVSSIKKTMNSRTPFLVVQSLILNTNEAHKNDLVKLAKSLGADKAEIKTTWFDLEMSTFNLLPEEEKYRRYFQDADKTWQLKNNLANRCFKMWSTTCVSWQGQLMPCCFDRDGEFSFGNINEKPLNIIWRNDKYYSFRKQVITNRKVIKICRNCTEGSSGTRRS